MELIFIRHGQGQHTVDTPESLQIKDLLLTPKGKEQAKLLRNNFPLSDKDIVVVSPIRRTLQTASLWCKDISCVKLVNPLVSPRMFPQNPDYSTLPCDEIMEQHKIKNEFSSFVLKRNLSYDLWSKGINTISEDEFNVLGKRFVSWCKQQSKEKVYIVSHDGTITSYRQLLSGKKLSRYDFPKETGWVSLNC